MFVFLPMITLISLLFSYYDNERILSHIFNVNEWELASSHSDTLKIYKKKIDGIDIPVFKATLITTVPLEPLVQSVLDGENHDEFLGKSHVVESLVIERDTTGTSFLYQMLDLPFIKDRHYITKNYTDTVIINNHLRLNWVIDNKSNQDLFADLIKDKSEEYGNPIFIKDGLGSWIVRSISEQETELSYAILIDPGGWVPSWVVTYAVKKLAPDTVLLMAKEGRRREYQSKQYIK